MTSLDTSHGGAFPKNREELYADAVDLLLDWWESPKMVQNARGEIINQQPSLAEWLKVDRQKVRALLEELAFNAQSLQQVFAGTADISETDLEAGLLRLSQNPEENTRQFLDYLSQRAGILMPAGWGFTLFHIAPSRNTWLPVTTSPTTVTQRKPPD